MKPAALLLLGCVCHAAKAAVQVSATWNVSGSDTVSLSQSTLDTGLRSMYSNAGIPFAGYSLDSLGGNVASAPPSSAPPTTQARVPPPPPDSNTPDNAVILAVSLSAAGVVLLGAAIVCSIPAPRPCRQHAAHNAPQSPEYAYQQQQIRITLKPLPYDR